MTDTHTIPLNKLVLCERNVRKTGAENDLGELIASIEAHGLLQSLVVRQAARGKFAVVAGGRRLRALQALAEARKVKAAMPVKCTVVADDADTVEISLAENVIRAPMHPADQFEAFKTVIDEGNATVADVAARFGVSESIVSKRLKLGRLSPMILAAYRNCDIDLEEAQAFTLSDNHAEQERIFSELKEHGLHAHTIRRALTQSEVPVTDKRARFVGLEAYEAAGGTIRRDLFADHDSAYLQDAALLDRLVAEKLDAAADEVRAEGWKRVDVMLEADYSDLSAYGRVHPQKVPLSKKLRKELDRLSKQYDKLAENADDAGDDVTERLDAIEHRIEEINASARKWSAKSLANSGAVVTLDYHGRLDIHRGLVHPDDVRQARKKASAKASSSEPATIPAALALDLTAHRTAAMQAVLAARPHIALAAVVHALALGVHYRGSNTASSLRIDASQCSPERCIGQPTTAKGLDALAAQRSRWSEQLPGDPDDLWSWCLDQPSEALLDLLAFLAACTADALHPKESTASEGRRAHANALATALKLDMSVWYVPTAENYFGRISRAQMLSAIEEAKGVPHAPALAKLKKGELAARAEAAVQGTRWLPSPLRLAAETLADDTEIAEAAE